MFIFIQGTHKDHNNAEKIASIMATMSSAKYNLKTLLLQVTEMQAPQAQKLLIGKKLEQSRIRLEEIKINDKGIDALLRRVNTTKLVKDHFDTIGEPLLEYENMLDSIGITQKADFETILTAKMLKSILTQSKAVYDNVFVFVNGKNQEIMAEVLGLADIVVTCFKQIPQKESYNVLPQPEDEKDAVAKKMIKVVTDYDPFSMYNMPFLKKLHNERKIFVQPLNTNFRDACLSETLLEFLLKNMNDSSEDYNYSFMKEIFSLMEAVIESNIKEEKDIKVEKFNPYPKEEKKESLEKVENFEEQHEKVKKWRFGKEKDVSKVVLLKESEKPLTMDDEDSVLISSSKTEKESEKPLTRKEKAKLRKEEKLRKKEEKETLKREQKKEKELQKRKKKAGGQNDNPEIEQEDELKWTCKICGTVNSGKFCSECGAKKQESWICLKCGRNNYGEVCEGCHTRKPWICSECGTVNTGKFCSECGQSQKRKEQNAV